MHNCVQHCAKDGYSPAKTVSELCKKIMQSVRPRLLSTIRLGCAQDYTSFVRIVIPRRFGLPLGVIGRLSP